MIDKLVIFCNDLYNINKILSSSSLEDTCSATKYAYMLNLDLGIYNYHFVNFSKTFSKIVNVKYNGFKFQILQNNPKKCFVQINPSDFPSYGEFINYINCLGLSDLSRITRADYTIDIYGEVQSFFESIYKFRSRSCRVYYGTDGLVETVYFGKNPLVRIYQKDRQLLAELYQKIDAKVVRIEIQRRYSIDDFFSIKSSFNESPFQKNGIEFVENTFDIYKKSFITLFGIHNLFKIFADQKHLKRFNQHVSKSYDLDDLYASSVIKFTRGEKFTLDYCSELASSKLPMSNKDYQLLERIEKEGTLPLKRSVVVNFQKLLSFNYVTIENERIGITGEGYTRLEKYRNNKAKKPNGYQNSDVI